MTVNELLPNTPSGANQAPSQTTPTQAAAYGDAAHSGTAERAETIQKVSRVLRVQLDHLADESWQELRELAREAAVFCNQCMADHYVRAIGYSEHPEGTIFVRAKGRLSGDVRVALARESFATWKRHGKRILAGIQALACFRLDRALVCRAEHMNKGKRQIHAEINFDGSKYHLAARLIGKEHGGRHVFPIWWKPQVDDYVQPVIDGLASGKIRLLKITFLFERPGQKVFALLTYESEIVISPPGEREATLGPLEEDGSLWLRYQSGPKSEHFNFTGHVMRLLHMKEHFTALRERIRQRTRRSGPGCRRDYRRALAKAGSFSEWAHGFIHEWSRQIVEHCRKRGVGYLAIGPMKHQDLPMAELEEKLKYKCQEAGIEISYFDPDQPSTDRAIKGAVAKKQRGIAAKRKALRTLREK